MGGNFEIFYLFMYINASTKVLIGAMTFYGYIKEQEYIQREKTFPGKWSVIALVKTSSLRVEWFIGYMEHVGNCQEESLVVKKLRRQKSMTIFY